MRQYTCCFTGHRIITDNVHDLRTALKSELVKLIESGIKYFGTGGAIGFDTLAAETVIDLKHNYPHIKLILVLPCPNQCKYWNGKDIKIYEKIKNAADKITCLSQHYYDGCMHTRNRHLVDNSSVCVCYCRKPAGGTAYTLEYALKSGLRIIRV